MFALCVALALPGRVLRLQSLFRLERCFMCTVSLRDPFLTAAFQYSDREALIHLKCILYSRDHC